MSNTWILFWVFLMFAGSAVCTYTKCLRDSWVFLAVMIATALLGSYLWVVATRRLETISDLLWFSLLWDILMVVAYYLTPLLFHEHKMNWQAWAAIGLIVLGILWFKLQTGSADPTPGVS
jgi:drug/metabolite transporter (DMT)-like permease